MIEISENIPFLWRLSSDNGEGFSVVSMVVPFHSGDEDLEHTIETDVLSFSSDLMRSEDEEVLEWNEDDISLFLKLLANKLAIKARNAQEQPASDVALADSETASEAAPQAPVLAGSDTPSASSNAFITETEAGQTFRVDLSDPDTIEIIHIVAAAGFGMAQPADDLLLESPYNATQIDFDHEIGAIVSLRTIDGYKQAVIVDTDEDEVVCVLLEAIRLGQLPDVDDIQPHDLLLVKSHFLLPVQYTSLAPGANDVLH